MASKAERGSCPVASKETRKELSLRPGDLNPASTLSDHGSRRSPEPPGESPGQPWVIRPGAESQPG